MHVHSLEHAPNEGAGRIADWARIRGYEFAATRLDRGDPLPSIDDIDLLVIMGGGMNIYQHRDFPWLVEEKRLIARAAARGKAMLGVCLGAQLIADVLGGKVVQNPCKEIGWFPVRFVDRQPPFEAFPAECTVFHWHGDTFELPARARRVAESDGCGNQAFLFGDRIAGLQFHIEVTVDAALSFCEGMDAELQPARFVQTREQIATNAPNLTHADSALWGLLDRLIAPVQKSALA
jgi:GMP synthase-like glutamine amidotransferase